MACMVHLMKTTKCQNNLFAQQHKESTALMTQKTTATKTARNLENEMCHAAPPVQLDGLEENNEFNLTVDETDNEGEEQNEINREIDNQASICYSTNDIVEIDLLKILNDANTPHYLYKEILQWGQKAQQMKYDFEPLRTKRVNQMLYIDKWFGLEYYNAKQIPITLPGPAEMDQPEKINVTCFDFTGMLRSLLTNEKLLET